ncbi:MAG TPA: hypothetical protein DDZ51_05480 [Planctomycetaceae bacterium]|nr:hypothetical protein [Planctomycetaceae bacterium]
MGRMGDGFWLDPKSGQHWKVTTHDAWILNGENALLVGISASEHERLTSLNPVRDVDEIRLAGIRVGLVRIRSYHNRISVQFAAPRQHVSEALSSTFSLLDGIEAYKDTPIDIDNLETGESERISLRELGLSLENPSLMANHSASSSVFPTS